MNSLMLVYSMDRNSIYYDDIMDEYTTILEQWNVEIGIEGSMIVLDFGECKEIDTVQEESGSIWHIEDFTEDEDLIKVVLNFANEVEAIDNEVEW